MSNRFENDEGRTEIDLEQEPEFRVQARPITAVKPSDADRATMTLNLSAREMAVLNALAAEMDVSKTHVVRSAIRLYQLVHVRLKEGERFMFSGDQQRVVEFIGPGFGQ